jgi:putative transposase
VVTPAQRRAVVTEIRSRYHLPERRACRFVSVQRALCRYRPRRAPDLELRSWLREAAVAHPRWGVPRLVWLRREVEGGGENHKRLERLYREEGLAVRRRPRKRLTLARIPRPLPVQPNERWSMDFVRDTLSSGRVFRAFTLVDDYTRESLAIEPDHSLPALRVIQVLERVITIRGRPAAIVCDNGPEFTSRAMLSWAHHRSIELRFIRPGKPIENCFVESFNGKFRDECLNMHWFLTLPDAQYRIESFRNTYNSRRPHSAHGKLTPIQFFENWKQQQEGQTNRLSA